MSAEKQYDIDIIRLVNWDRRLQCPQFYYRLDMLPEQMLWTKRISQKLFDAVTDPNMGLYSSNTGTTNAQKAWLYFEGRELVYPDGSVDSLALDADAAGIDCTREQQLVLRFRGKPYSEYRRHRDYMESVHDIYKSRCSERINSFVEDTIPKVRTRR